VGESASQGSCNVYDTIHASYNGSGQFGAGLREGFQVVGIVEAEGGILGDGGNQPVRRPFDPFQPIIVRQRCLPNNASDEGRRLKGVNLSPLY